MEEAIEIRNAKHSDLARVRELQQQWAAENNAYGFLPDSGEYLERRLSHVFLVAEERGEVIGFAVGTCQENKEHGIFKLGEKFLLVEDVYVASEFRKRNIGGELLDGLLEKAEKMGVRRSLVHSSVKDLDPIIRFYRSHGFKTWNIQLFR